MFRFPYRLIVDIHKRKKNANKYFSLISVAYIVTEL